MGTGANALERMRSLTDQAGSDVNEAPRRRAGLTHRGGLTNGATDHLQGMEVGVGLINGVPDGGNGRGKGKRRLHMPFGKKRRRRAVRDALERKAREPLPGADGE